MGVWRGCKIFVKCWFRSMSHHIQKTNKGGVNNAVQLLCVTIATNPPRSRIQSTIASLHQDYLLLSLALHSCPLRGLFDIHRQLHFPLLALRAKFVLEVQDLGRFAMLQYFPRSSYFSYRIN